MAISPARIAAFDILLRVETEDAYASELLHSSLLDRLSPPDRGLATEIVMGALRCQAVLDRQIATASDKSTSQLDAAVRVALRMAAYQLLFLDRVPGHAAVHESVELVKRARKRSAAGFVNAVLRRVSGQAKLPASPRWRAASEEETVEAIAEDAATPLWLVRRWAERFGAPAAAKIAAWGLTEHAPALRMVSSSVEDELRSEGVELRPGKLLRSTRLAVGGDVTKSSAFREGRAQIQDEASQLVALVVGRVGSGGRILDCCAAPGGKTSVIAARNPAAKVVAVEMHPQRAELTRRRVREPNVEVITADARDLPRGEGYDRVLADVPCSGTGTLARNPEIKWRLKPEKLAELHALQVAILSAALDQLVAGGKLVYSTCSLEREEDEDVVEEVMRARTDVELGDVREELALLVKEGELVAGDVDSLVSGKFLRTLPGAHPCDGFFAAVLRKKWRSAISENRVAGSAEG
ncbi:MAG: 16S rRNA (cytosine(967)-C(5))-methyltransferase RsmB [Candidatus Koribacter versatilis]|uniref:16S rRNA (Cytosine(967)-C(5))-methyltransferase RsmB n=1 Tax=Candidatus Korobacter versatilis TaxID=658062 RepID=A0A932A9A9_9BACT|nr:16S rRNA (cytosine(967)-C(5))-methyltransferase RsmB [Candidatus Koribacter versatilis]